MTSKRARAELDLQEAKSRVLGTQEALARTSTLLEEYRAERQLLQKEMQTLSSHLQAVDGDVALIDDAITKTASRRERTLAERAEQAAAASEILKEVVKSRAEFGMEAITLPESVQDLLEPSTAK